MDKRLGVDVLNTGNELIGEEQDGLQGELAVAEVEEILQTGSEEVKDHCIVVTLGSEPADKWDSDTTSKGLIDTSLIFELGVLGLDALKLDGNLLAGDDVGPEVNVTETAATNLTTDTVLVADAKILEERGQHVDVQDVLCVQLSSREYMEGGTLARGCGQAQK
jgi:hypothetical protein